MRVKKAHPVVPHLLPLLLNISDHMARMKPLKDLEFWCLLKKMGLDVDWA